MVNRFKVGKINSDIYLNVAGGFWALGESKNKNIYIFLVQKSSAQTHSLTFSAYFTEAADTIGDLEVLMWVFRLVWVVSI